MKAAVIEKYGSIDSLRVQEVEKPEPTEDEVRLKVFAASVNPSDLHLIKGKHFGSRFGKKRRIPGIDVSGMVDAMGPNAMDCSWGDEVYADLSNHGYGSFAEYVCVPRSAIALKPKNLDYIEAACVPYAATSALQGLVDEGDIFSHRSALIVGASGGVGHFAVQIAKNYDLQVTGVARTEKLDFVKTLGADFVLDYTKEDYMKSDNHYELIFDTAGQRSAFKFRKMLTRDGRYVAIAATASALLQTPIIGILNNRRVKTFRTRPSTEDLATLRKLIEKGSVKPNVDKVFSLDEVPQALKYLESGQVKGKIAIHVSDG